jgi:hypothetical protein
MVDVPNVNFPEGFGADDIRSLRRYVESLKRVYLLNQDKKKSFQLNKPFPWEVQAEIKALKRVEEILEKDNIVYGRPPRLRQCSRDDQDYTRRRRKALAIRKLAILVLRRDRRAKSALLTKPPRGHQMNYYLDWCTWCLAEEVKKTKGRFYWDLVADLLSKYLEIPRMEPNQALKVHKRFVKLRENREKLFRVTGVSKPTIPPRMLLREIYSRAKARGELLD